MNEKSKKIKEATCEIEVAFGVIGGKWKPLILWYLGECGTLRFGQLPWVLPEVKRKCRSISFPNGKDMLLFYNRPK